MQTEPASNRKVGRVLIADYRAGGIEEQILLEYRYTPGDQFELFTRICDKVYHLTAPKFFGVLSDLLDQLPADATLSMPHKAILCAQDGQYLVDVIEHLGPYATKNSDTVVYRLSLSFNGQPYHTGEHFEFARAFDELQSLVGAEYHFQVCHFCRYLFEDYVFGGTDGRHDQLYCFRDIPGLLSVIGTPQDKFNPGRRFLSQGMPDVDAFHSCSAFERRSEL